MATLLQPKVVVSSHLGAEPRVIWDEIASLDGVNREMAPWLRMIPPPGTDLADAASGEVFRLRLRGPGGLPLGGYPLQLRSYAEGAGFLEQTRIARLVLWQHQRTISADGDGGTLITDALGWVWRAALLDPVLAAAVRRFFGHRHRVLRDRHGGGP